MIYHSPTGRGKGSGSQKGKGPKKKKNEDWRSVLRAQPSSGGWFPTEIETAYLASVRLPHGTSLLIDTGSPNNIASDGWAEDHARELHKAGLPAPVYEQMAKPLVCSGIGHGTQQADHKGTYKICLGSGRLDDYHAPELPNAQTPALLGQRSMKKLRALIDTFTGEMYLVGRVGTRST